MDAPNSIVNPLLLRCAIAKTDLYPMPCGAERSDEHSLSAERKSRVPANLSNAAETDCVPGSVAEAARRVQRT